MRRWDTTYCTRQHHTSSGQRQGAVLREKVEDLEQFHDLVVNRELKMMELERGIAKLQQENEALRSRAR